MLRPLLPLLALVLGLLLAVPGLAAEGWTRFNSQEGRFSVMVPGAPQHRSSTNDTPIGPVVENSYVCQRPGESFTVSFTDLPGMALLFEGRPGLYDKAREALLKQVAGRQVSFQPLQVGGREARVLDYALKSGGKEQAGRAWFVLVGRRLYVVDATIPKAKAPKGFEPFFSSLKLTGD